MVLDEVSCYTEFTNNLHCSGIIYMMFINVWIPYLILRGFRSLKEDTEAGRLPETHCRFLFERVKALDQGFTVL